MFDAILSIATGGATGLLGTVLSGVLGFFKQRQAHAQELELRKLDLEMMDKEAQFALAQEEVKAESAERQAEWEGLKASYAEASVRWSGGLPLTAGQGWCLVIVDLVRGLMRPGLTVGLVALVAVIYSTQKGGPDLEVQIVNTVLYLSTAATLWWFGSRQVEKALK